MYHRDSPLVRLIWAGPLTVLISVVAVLLVRIVAVLILQPDVRFAPRTLRPPIFDTVILGTGAVLVFLALGRWSSNPVRVYRFLAAGVLAVSLTPDVALAMRHWFGGAWPEAFALMAMHVAVWALCVTLLPGLTAAKN